ncbi:MAG: lysophospholipid acyltransferase family protein [Xanthomonadaceae bacterium]|jgi:1-acyl-sn-glycerol-3-phosphate acyltransferase|nr:lysophospholipid acyltransferase family protein [Xanthomonadaceae bacterium]
MTEVASTADPAPPLVSLPPSAPRRHSAATRRAAAWVLRVCGWRITGAFPDVPRLVLIAAPHSSGWDAVWGLLVKLALGLHIEFMGKREIFWWPLGPVLRFLGGFPVNRQAAGGVVEQLTERMRASDSLWLVLAPEGTRRRVGQWKSGFWRVARDAGVPICCAAFHYPQKRIHIGPVFTPSADFNADHAAIRAWYRPYVGKHRDTL